MEGLTATQLAEKLLLSKGRISQMAGEGRLDGCFTGDGRLRRYNLSAVAERLRVKLDPGQSLGNGASTRAVVADILSSEVGASQKPPRSDGVLPSGDDDSYQLVRKAKLEEELKRLRRQNALEAGTLVLASEVERQVSRVMRQELAEIEEMLRTAARAVADQLAVDARQVRKILVDTWRVQRAGRSAALMEAADLAVMNEAEVGEDI